MDPNKGNGGQTEKYSWTQTLTEVSVVFSVAESTGELSKRDVKVDFDRSKLNVVIKGDTCASGELFGPVSPEDCFWQLDVADRTVSLFMEKATVDMWWKCVIKGDGEIDTTKVEPENSRLEDLDPESRSLVEKMMVEQREKAMRERGFVPPGPAGLTSEQADMLRKLQEQNPDMDFSGAKMT